MDGLGAVVLAGGKGTRMRSALPKAGHRLLGLALGAWPVRLAHAAGAQPVVAVVGALGGPIEAALRDGAGDAPLRFALQAAPRGTADAVAASEAATEGLSHLFLLNGDVPLFTRESMTRLVATYRASGEALALASCVLADGGSYGRVLRDADGAVRAIREARDATAEERTVREVNVGAYLVRRALLYDALRRLTPDNAQGELYLTDLVERLRADGHRVAAVALEDPAEMQGVNTREELAQAAAVLRARINRHWMLEGVSLEDPATTVIEPDVRLGADTVLGPGVVLRGRTRIGADVRVGPGAVLVDAVVGDRAVIGPYAVLEGIHVPADGHVPPHARG